MTNAKTETPRRTANNSTSTPKDPRSIKRKAELNPLPSDVSDMAVEYTEGDPGTKHCHLCRQPMKTGVTYIQCTCIKNNQQCNNRFHARYNGDCFTKDAKASPMKKSKSTAAQQADHIEGTDYLWRCPKCDNCCNCTICVPKPKQTPAGDDSKNNENVEGPPKKKQKTSSAAAASTPQKGVQVVITKAKLESGKKKASKGSSKLTDSETRKLIKKGGQQKIDLFVQVSRTKLKDQNGSASQDPKAKAAKDKKASKKKEVATPATPKPKKPVKPAPVAEPKFHELFLGDAPTERFQIRDFIVRFGKDQLRIVATHVRNFADLEKSWSYTGLKMLVINALSLIADEQLYDLEDNEKITDAITTIRKARAESDEMWTVLQDLVFNIFGTMPGDAGNYNLETLEGRLAMIQGVLYATIGTQGIRERLELNASQLHQETKDTKSLIKEQSKILKENNKEDKKALKEIEAILASYEKFHKMKLWFKKRKLCGNFNCLGKDIIGNTYWLIVPVDKDDTWANPRIFVEKAEDVSLPIVATTQLKDADVNGHETKSARLKEKETEKRNRELAELPEASKTWFYVEGSQSIYDLVKWVEYKANIAFYEREIKKYGSKAASGNGTPSKFVVRVDTPNKKIESPLDAFSKDDSDAIVKKLRDVGDMLAAFEMSKESEQLFQTYNLQLSTSSKSRK